MKMKNVKIVICRKFLFLIFAVFASFLFCTSLPSNTRGGGSGTEAPNAIVLISDSGRLYGASGCRVVVGAFDSTYVPYNDSGLDTLTLSDTGNRFDFGFLKTGTYNVVVTDLDSGMAAFFSGIHIAPCSVPDTFKSDLAAVGSISGYVRDSSGIAYPILPVYLLGSPFFSRTDRDGHFLIQEVPPGDFHMLTKRVIMNPQGPVYGDTLMADTICIVLGSESTSVGVMMLK
jgi:hypothetical protein